MTTFQAIIYGLIQGFSAFLPISARAHQVLVPFLFSWPEPNGAFIGSLSLGSFIALLVYFRHDWASVISCFLQVVIYRKRPMTLDERLPFFLLISTIPAAVAWYYGHDAVSEMNLSPLGVAIIFGGYGILLWFIDSMSRKNKGMFDWNWLDSLIVGVAQSFMLFPGIGQLDGALAGALFLNYKREAAAKYAYFAAAPILFASVLIHLKGIDFHAATPMPEISWLSFWVSLVVTVFAGMLAIGGFMKQIHQKGVSQYTIYRCVVALGVGITYFLKSRA